MADDRDERGGDEQYDEDTSGVEVAQRGIRDGGGEGEEGRLDGVEGADAR